MGHKPPSAPGNTVQTQPFVIPKNSRTRQMYVAGMPMEAHKPGGGGSLRLWDWLHGNSLVTDSWMNCRNEEQNVCETGRQVKGKKRYAHIKPVASPVTNTLQADCYQRHWIR